MYSQIGANELEENESSFSKCGKSMKDAEGQNSENRTLLQHDYIEMQSSVKSVMDIIEERMQLAGVITGLPTGFTNLDEMILGLQPSDLIVLAGRPNTAKSIIAMNIVVNAAIITNAPVAIFSYHTSPNIVVERLLSVMSDIDGHRLHIGNLDKEDYVKLLYSSYALPNAPIYVSEPQEFSLEGLLGTAHHLKREKDIQLIVIDHLQLLNWKNEDEGREQEFTIICRELKKLAKDLNIPVLILSQLSCKVEQRPRKIPELYDLMEYGSIDQVADNILLLYRYEVCDRSDPTLSGRVEMFVAKHRHGPTGEISIRLQKNFYNNQSLYLELSRPDTGEDSEHKSVPLSSWDISEIQRTVAAYYKVSPNDLRSRKRHHVFSHPRQVAMYLCTQLLKISSKKIGQLFGKRSHASVLRAVKKIKKQQQIDENLSHELRSLTEMLSD
jgi:replicative DNA helicase